MRTKGHMQWSYVWLKTSSKISSYVWNRGQKHGVLLQDVDRSDQCGVMVALQVQGEGFTTLYGLYVLVSLTSTLPPASSHIYIIIRILCLF